MARSTEIATILQSADPGQNTGMGGHVTQHILGMTPPAGKSQLNKTLFRTRREFEAIWRQYLYYSGGVNCSGGQAQQSVTCAILHVGMIDALSCTAADAQGRCTSYNSYVAQSFFFGFLLVGHTWVLNTCFPEPMA